MNGGNDPYSGLDVTGNGFTYTDTHQGNTVIRVVYDVSQCCGQGIYMFDTDGNHISSPNPTILYHELSHAFRAATGTQATNDEPPAETDENVMRSELGVCLRDVNNHDGGCGTGNDCGGSDGGTDGGPPAGGCAAGNSGGCFIVSATTGSADSAEVTALRALRDRVSSLSNCSGRLIDAIYGEYFQVSPSIAADLEQDAVSRKAALWIVVRPLIAWYNLAGLLALERPDAERIKRGGKELLDACPSYLGRGSIARLLEKLRSEGALAANAPKQLREFAPRLEVAAGMRFASWAILDPLLRAWQTAAGGGDPVPEVAAWLANAPLEALAPPDALEEDRELEVLAGFFAFQPQARQSIGARLAAAWPGAAKALERHGFLPKRGAL